MKSPARLIAALVVVFTLALLCTSPARASNCAPTITEPCTIAINGTYVLGTTLNITGVPAGPLGYKVGIRIAPEVTEVSINCDIFGIYHDGGYDQRGVGIYGEKVSNVTITGCNIFGSGMLFGINIDNEAAPTHRGITIRDTVVSARLIGIVIRSEDATVSDVFCRYIGRQTIWQDAYPGCISVFGARAKLTDNRANRFETYFGVEVFGISCSYCAGSLISGNVVENTTTVPKSWAYWLNSGGTITVDGNRAVNFHNGFGLVTGSSGTLNGNTFKNVVNEFAGGEPPTWP